MLPYHQLDSVTPYETLLLPGLWRMAPSSQRITRCLRATRRHTSALVAKFMVRTVRVCGVCRPRLLSRCRSNLRIVGFELETMGAGVMCSELSTDWSLSGGGGVSHTTLPGADVGNLHIPRPGLDMGYLVATTTCQTWGVSEVRMFSVFVLFNKLCCASRCAHHHPQKKKWCAPKILWDQGCVW